MMDIKEWVIRLMKMYVFACFITESWKKKRLIYFTECSINIQIAEDDS